MKAIMFALLFFIICSVSFADNKILLTGKPIILVPEADYYLFPKTYNPSTNYNFINISGDNRICFLAPQAKLKVLDLLKIYIVLTGKKFLWFCYRYNPAFFSIDFQAELIQPII